MKDYGHKIKHNELLIVSLYTCTHFIHKGLWVRGLLFSCITKRKHLLPFLLSSSTLRSPTLREMCRMQIAYLSNLRLLQRWPSSGLAFIQAAKAISLDEVQ